MQVSQLLVWKELFCEIPALCSVLILIQHQEEGRALPWRLSEPLQTGQDQSLVSAGDPAALPFQSDHRRVLMHLHLAAPRSV